MNVRHFLSTADYTTSELDMLLNRAAELKAKRADASDAVKTLTGKSVALVFFNPSLRTRASMQIGVYELGGNAVVLEPGGSSWTLEHRAGAVMDADKTEHVAEFVRVLGRYCAVIGVRCFAAMQDYQAERLDPVLRAFADYSTIPVINLESAMGHPCQAMADIMTIRERFGRHKQRVVLTWAWHPKPLPMAVPNSFALAAAQAGHDVIIAHPQGYELDDELMNDAREFAGETGGSVQISHDIKEAFKDADVIYAKSWGSRDFYGASEKDIAQRASLRAEWIVDKPKMQTTNDAIFMHCLPVRRNVIVTDEVIDSPRSVVITQAENRLHVQKAILEKVSSEP